MCYSNASAWGNLISLLWFFFYSKFFQTLSKKNATSWITLGCSRRSGGRGWRTSFALLVPLPILWWSLFVRFDAVAFWITWLSSLEKKNLNCNAEQGSTGNQQEILWWKQGYPPILTWNSLLQGNSVTLAGWPCFHHRIWCVLLGL